MPCAARDAPNVGTRRVEHVDGELPVRIVVVDREDAGHGVSSRHAGPTGDRRRPSARARGRPAAAEADPDLEVAAVCGDLESLLAAVESEQPDVVVTDIRMPPGNSDEGIQAAERLRTTNPDIGVVVLSQYATPSYALALLESGSASGRTSEGTVQDQGRAGVGDARSRTAAPYRPEVVEASSRTMRAARARR